MALNPALSFSIENDNKKITIIDSTADYGVGGNLAINGITTLTLDIIITRSNNVSTTYDTIDLYALNQGPFGLQSEMIFEINPSLLLVGSTALGSVDDEFPDGIYNFIYTINTPLASVEYDVLLDGRVTNYTHELLRLMPESYLYGRCDDKEVLDVIFTMSLIDSMESSAYVGNNEAILEQLSVIERLITNGSNYTW